MISLSFADSAAAPIFTIITFIVTAAALFAVSLSVPNAKWTQIMTKY